MKEKHSSRRFKKACIKKKILRYNNRRYNAFELRELINTGYLYNQVFSYDKINQIRSCYTYYNPQEVKAIVRKRLRNEGRLKHSAKDRYKGCGRDCPICNPGYYTRHKYYPLIGKTLNEYDLTDFLEFINE